MPIDEYNQDANVINRFCNSRGYGNEVKGYLHEKAKDRQRGFDSLAEHRNGFRPIDNHWCEQQVLLMNENPMLF